MMESPPASGITSGAPFRVQQRNVGFGHKATT